MNLLLYGYAISWIQQCFIYSIGGGATGHTAGLVGVFKPSLAQVRLVQSSVSLYKSLEKRGLPTGWKQCGSLCLAKTRDRMTVFRRMQALSVSVYQSSRFLSLDLH